MSEKKFASRRSFLKKAVVTAGVTGGVLSNAQTVAAASQSVDVNGYQDGSTYTIHVNDPDAYGGSNLEGDDTVHNGSSKSKFSGTVDNGDTDTFHFDGQVTGLVLDGDLEAVVNNPNGMNIGGDMTVEGSDTDYSAIVTDSLTAQSDCESDDNVSGDTVNGHCDLYDTDTYSVNGTIEYATVIPGSSVTFDHKI